MVAAWMWAMAWVATLLVARAPERLDAVLLADGDGGHWLAWSECAAGGPAALRLTRLGRTGVPRAPWPAAGLAVSASPDAQRDARLARDGEGGVWVAWTDRREGPRRVHAARVGPDGRLGASPRRVGAAGREDFAPALAAAPDGGVLVAWQSWDGRGSDVHVQRLAPDGEPAPGWPAAGLAAADSPFDECAPHWLPDREGPSLAWTAYDGPDPARGHRREAVLAPDAARFRWREGPFGRTPGR